MIASEKSALVRNFVVNVPDDMEDGKKKENEWERRLYARVLRRELRKC